MVMALRRLNVELQAEIAERERAEEALKEYSERLQALTVRLSEAEEVERQRVARELHDQVGQNLIALRINLSIVRAKIAEETTDLVGSYLDDLLTLLDQMIDRTRSIMDELRPPMLDDLGLMATLRWWVGQITSQSDIAMTVRGEEPDPHLPAHVESALFRIAQEALINVVRHASATHATVTVEVDDETVHLVIADNGVGFDPARVAGPDEHQGRELLTMTERAEVVGGCCRVESSPQQGTRVVVAVRR